MIFGIRGMAALNAAKDAKIVTCIFLTGYEIAMGHTFIKQRVVLLIRYKSIRMEDTKFRAGN